MFHGPVEQRSKAKADPHFIDTATNLFGRELQIDSERFEDIGGPRGTGCPTISMFGNGLSCGSCDQRRSRTDVKGVQQVATGTTGVEKS
jgi:hypothetical protein